MSYDWSFGHKRSQDFRFRSALIGVVSSWDLAY